MEIRQLNTFRMVVQTMSFSQAAQALNYAQSTVTAQIQALEEELGVPLFNRLGRKITLTQAGENLRWYAQKLTDLEEEARSVIVQQDEPMGSITFGAPESVLTYHLPRLLRRYRDQFPLVKLIFQPCPSYEIVDAVRDGLMDVAIPLWDPIQSPNLTVHHLSEEDLVLIAAPDHPLGDGGLVQPSELENENIILTELGCSYRHEFEHVLQMAGVNLRSRFELNSIQAMKQCVIAGLGIALLPRYTIYDELEKGQVVILPYHSPVVSHIQLVYHRDRWLSPALTEFINLAKTMLTVEASLAAGD